MPQEKYTRYCSFCGKSQHEVKKLIAGPATFICEECVILCFDIVVEEGFYDRGHISREAQAVRRERRLAETLKLIRAILDTENARHMPYALVEKRLLEIEGLESAPAEDVKPK